uniref:Uncharacterized protein n=1 Tax=viral metagenome TaxID=1070528 RepID=A0A6M3X4V2_9ZZZZ
MSFRGQVIKREKINTPLGPGELVTTEYPTPKRRKVIWWMGEGKIAELGELITYYMAEPRESDFEEITWKPYFFEVKLKDIADPSEGIEMLTGEEGDLDFEFDELEEAEEFISLIKCKVITYGTIEIDSRAEFERWASILKVGEEKETK